MFAIAKTAPEAGLTAIDQPQVAKLAPNDVRIAVKKAGVCGTDLHIYRWDSWAQGRIKPPLILGHEFVGEVIEVGSHVTAVQKGQRVSGECHIVCNQCRPCRTGNAHLCEKTVIIGVDRAGAFAEQLIMPEQNLWPIADEVPDHHAAIFDPMGNAMHTVMQFSLAGKVVLITGVGSIGLMAVAMAKAAGAARVLVLEPQAHKRKLATNLGADAAIDATDAAAEGQIKEAAGSQGIDVLLEMSGNVRALEAGCRVLNMGGQVALLGIPSQPITFDLGNLLVFKGLEWKGIIGRKMFETWYQVDAFARHHPQVIEQIISHQLPARDFQKGFELFDKGQSVKVVLDLTA